MKAKKIAAFVLTAAFTVSGIGLSQIFGINHDNINALLYIENLYDPSEYKEGPDGFKYVITNGYDLDNNPCEYASIIEYPEDKTSVTIPEEINGLKVDISRYYGNKNNITKEITIPAGVFISPYIGYIAENGPGENGGFQFFSALEKVVFEEGVKYISTNMFFGCEKLETVELPETLEKIGNYAFVGCPALKNINIPDSVKSIGQNLFDDYYMGHESDPHIVPASRKIELIESENGIDYLENWALGFSDDNTERKSIILREGTVGVAKCAFSGEENVSEISLPDSIRHFSDGSFSGCGNNFEKGKLIEKFIIPEGVTEIKTISHESESSGCFSFIGAKQIVLPESLRDAECFSFNSAYLETDELPEFVVYKNSYAENFVKENEFKYTVIEKPSSGDNTDFITGDADGNGVINSADIILLIKHIISGSDSISLSAADFNKDGTVNVMDLIHLKKMMFM